MINELATKLSQLRKLKGASLRKVEAVTGISNAYLSQLERGLAAQPAPEKLKRLAEFYGVSYEVLLEAAGYLDRIHVKKGQIGAAITNKPAPLQEAIQTADLSEEETAMVIDYIVFIRSRSKT